MANDNKKNTTTSVRPVFSPSVTGVGVQEIDVQFTWYMGMSIDVRRRSIHSLHKNCQTLGFSTILEVSSKSEQPLGIQLSAFYLTNIIGYPVENIFQSSKVFKNGGPYRDLLHVSPKEAKRDERLKNSGDLVKFTLNNKDFPLEPKSLFYDWVYINVLFSERNNDLRTKLFQSSFDAFSDIEFNPSKSLNCQARTLALCVSLYNNECVNDFIADPIGFASHHNIYSTKKIQPSLF